MVSHEMPGHLEPIWVQMLKGIFMFGFDLPFKAE